MNNIRWYQAFMLLLCVLVTNQGFAQQEQSHSDSLDTIKIEKLTGVKGKLDAVEHVFKVSVPRTDLTATVAGVKMIPPDGAYFVGGFQIGGQSGYGHGRPGVAGGPGQSGAEHRAGQRYRSHRLA